MERRDNTEITARVLAAYLAISPDAAARLVARMTLQDRGEVLCARLLYDSEAIHEVRAIVARIEARQGERGEDEPAIAPQREAGRVALRPRPTHQPLLF